MGSGIKASSFSLAKGRSLTGDDFYDVKILPSLTIAVVCDGVGSATAGQEAAKRVVNYLVTNFKNRPLSWDIPKTIERFLTSINTILYNESLQTYERPELVTTVAMVVIEGNRLYGANVGDSRVYLHRGGDLTMLSRDHTLEDEGFRHVLSQTIGGQEDVSPYYFENIITPHDHIMICSDGLYAVMTEQEMREATTLGAHSLVKRASTKVGDDLPDDTTAVVIEVHEVDLRDILRKQELIIPENLKEGETIDHYTLVSPLDFKRRTWQAVKENERVIMKFAPYEAEEDKQQLDLFVQEAWNARRLKAGFFPKAEIPHDRTYRYYVMELLEGSDLKTYLKKRKLGIEDTILLGKTILRMGQYLLKYDLVHGDIKPENIIVTERDGKHIFKVIDFGSMTEIFSIDSQAGTPSYLAPERFVQGAICEGSEIYALGVTLYEALTGHYPYGEIEPFQTPHFTYPKPPSYYNPNLPLWLESVILRAVASDPARRYEYYSEMGYDLEHQESVKPFIGKEIPLIERIPPKVAQYGFVIMSVIFLWHLISNMIK